MRALIIASIVIVPLILSYGLRAVTGDAISAAGLGLILLVTVIAWFGGRPVGAGELKRS